jgi:hypothetical protein
MMEPVLKERSGVAEDEERARMQREAERQSIYGPAGPPKAAATAPIEDLDAVLARRRDLAQECLKQARRATRADLWQAPALLVVVTHQDCRADCEAARAAIALSDQYRIDGLRVLMIDTTDNDSTGAPPGMQTVVLSQCRDLVSEQGDDYFVRDAQGGLSSAGERHEAALRQAHAARAKGKKKPPPPLPPFAPEALVKRTLGL